MPGDASMTRENDAKRKQDEAAAHRRWEYRAANYKPPVITAPPNDTELWRSVTNGLTIVCVKNAAGGTRTYVEKNDAFRRMEAAYADGL